MNYNTMQHKNIPYQHDEWLYNKQKCSAYTCKYFNFYPYHIISFPANTEAEMKEKIDHYIDNRSDILKGLELERKAAAVFYQTLDYKGD